MSIQRHLCATAVLGALALGVAACTPADNDADRETTVIETTREVPAAPVVVEREVAVPSPPVVIERDAREGDSTTVRAGENGIEVETTNR